MMDVYWLEQTEEDVREENDWLSPSEVALLNGLRFAKRRSDRRLGLWTGKQAAVACLSSPHTSLALSEIEIRHAPSGAPKVFVHDKPVALAVSLSHRNSRAMCAVAPVLARLGCDLERVESHSSAFVADFFTAEEQCLVAQHLPADRAWIIALLWSAKESALKALEEGLRIDTRGVIARPVETSFDPNTWNPLQVEHTGGQTFHGWWQKTKEMVRTLVAAPAPAAPIRLDLSDALWTRAGREPQARPLMKAGEESEACDLRRGA